MNANQLMQMINQLRQNPMQILAQHGIQISPDMANNPNAIIQQMLNSGRITQSQYNQAVQMARQFMPKQ